MRFQGALVREQGVSFAIIIVKKHVLDSHQERQDLAQSFTHVFSGVPIVLMAQDFRGIPTYWGRPDIVRFLSKVPMEAIPWKEYTLN